MRLALITLALTVVMAAPAQAYDPISFSYCRGDASFAGSLRGGGTLAPDNDIANYRTALNNQGYYIPTHYRLSEYRIGFQDIRVLWRFVDQYANNHDRYFRCWRGSDGVFHDGTA